MSNQNITQNKFSNIPSEFKEVEQTTTIRTIGFDQPCLSAPYGNQASTVLDKNIQGAEHKLDPSLSFELKYHEPLHHVNKGEIHDNSEPVLSTRTDMYEQKQQPITSFASSQSSLSTSTAPSTVDNIKAAASSVASSISHSAANITNTVGTKINELAAATQFGGASSSSMASMSTSSIPAYTPAVRHTLPAEIKQEVLHHEALHHVPQSQIDDQSAPVLSTPTDRLLPKTSTASSLPSAADISSSLSSTAHTVAEKLEHVGDVISKKAAEVYHSMAPLPATHASGEVPLVRHTLPAEIKQEVLHHEALHHVPQSQIDDQSAPVLSTPTDRLLPKTSTATTSSVAADISSSLSSTAHTVAEKLEHVGDVISKKAAEVYHSMSAPSTTASLKQSTTSPLQKYSSHTLNPEMANEIKFNQPQLHHVPTSDHSAPVLTTPTDNMIPKINHHNIAIPTPQHPHVQLHPGKVDVSHIQPTVPHDHSNNLLAQQKYDGSAYEVNEGGLGWSIPLNDKSAVSNAPLTVTYGTTSVVDNSSQSSQFSNQQPLLSQQASFIPDSQYQGSAVNQSISGKFENQQPNIVSSQQTTVSATKNTTTPSA